MSDAAPSPGDLQFRRAEFDGGSQPELRCTACAQPTGASYFQLSGAPVCESCAAQWQRLQGRPPAGRLMRGVAFGFGAAVAGAAGVGLLAVVAKIQLAIAAIGVGWLVGRAFRQGTGGLGSRRCQVLAAALAYFGIAMGYAPLVWKGLAGGLVFRAIVTFLVSLAAPFLELAADGFSGIIGMVIVAVGVAQAWRMTGADLRTLSGPYSTRPEEPGPQPAE